jgi:excisionase family DNA binding protein
MSNRTPAQAVIEPVFLRVPEAMDALRLGRSTIYELIRSGRLIACHEGTATLIPVESIRNYKALLMKEAVSAR